MSESKAEEPKKQGPLTDVRKALPTCSVGKREPLLRKTQLRKNKKTGVYHWKLSKSDARLACGVERSEQPR